MKRNYEIIHIFNKNMSLKVQYVNEMPFVKVPAGRGVWRQILDKMFISSCRIIMS